MAYAIANIRGGDEMGRGSGGGTRLQKKKNNLLNDLVDSPNT